MTLLSRTGERKQEQDEIRLDYLRLFEELGENYSSLVSEAPHNWMHSDLVRLMKHETWAVSCIDEHTKLKMLYHIAGVFTYDRISM